MKLSSVRIVLVAPENPGNIGAVARAMANTGLRELRLVSPGDWKTVEAWRMGWHAEDILEGARVFDSLGEAIAESTYVAGISGRASRRVPPIPIRRMADRVRELGDDDIVSLVFGCETNGLSEEDLLACHARVRIPSHPLQPSLNLAQAVMVTAYEVYLALGEPVGPTRSTELAPVESSEPALRALRDAMVEIGFLTRQSPETRFAEWRGIFGRSGIRRREVKLILALARRLKGAARIAARARSLQIDRRPVAEGSQRERGDTPEDPG